MEGVVIVPTVFFGMRSILRNRNPGKICAIESEQVAENAYERQQNGCEIPPC